MRISKPERIRRNVCLALGKRAGMEGGPSTEQREAKEARLLSLMLSSHHNRDISGTEIRSPFLQNRR